MEIAFERGEVYEYKDLLNRLFEIIENKHGGLNSGEKYTMKTPHVSKLGSKKTTWINFKDICDIMKRSPEHVSSFVYAELGCDGNFAGDQFILKGRFYQKNIEAILRRYIKEYVTCQMCKSPNTTLVKDASTRLNNLVCGNCGASRSTISIKSGYHATSKADRKAAKTNADKMQLRG